MKCNLNNALSIKIKVIHTEQWSSLPGCRTLIYRGAAFKHHRTI